MPSLYIYIPILFLCAPIILSVAGTFTALAIITSSLALIVISIRLGFLAVEFSGGVVLDFLRWGINRILGGNLYNIKNKKETKRNIKIKETTNKDNAKTTKPQKSKYNKTHIKQSSSISSMKYIPSKKTILETTKVYSPNSFGISNDDYFMFANNNQRPNGRRARSDYCL